MECSNRTKIFSGRLKRTSNTREHRERGGVIPNLEGRGLIQNKRKEKSSKQKNEKNRKRKAVMTQSMKAFLRAWASMAKSEGKKGESVKSYYCSAITGRRDGGTVVYPHINAPNNLEEFLSEILATPSDRGNGNLLSHQDFLSRGFCH